MATSSGAVVESPRVLSIQSHVVSGYVGNKCAVFPLQALGFEVDFINSVQFSNHTGYGQWKGQILADTDLEDLYEGLKMNNLVNYSQILTGYVGSESFLRKIRDVVMRIKEKNPSAIYLCDPVLGDNGHFYVPESLIPIYQNEVLPLADITTPNNFELELLSGMKVTSEAEAMTAMDILHQKGIPIVVLSSLDASGNDLASYVSFRDSKDGPRRVWKTIIPRLQGIFTGTGDLFAALFLGVYSKLGKQNIPRVIESALSTMKVVLGRTKEKADQRNIPVLPGEKPKPSELQLVQSLDVILNPPSSCAAVEVNLGA
ncbi:unnamed protein product [Orchesella dallaii]|uniref:Pyridoxal kinase n=1 Tax=Orchesella dallaii TaxID=48710 RepID=A0ABP1Q6B6_9HEXA